MANKSESSMIDLNPVEVIQIQISGDKVWVNIDGVCRLRAYSVKNITVDYHGANVIRITPDDAQIKIPNRHIVNRAGGGSVGSGGDMGGAGVDMGGAGGDGGGGSPGATGQGEGFCVDNS